MSSPSVRFQLDEALIRQHAMLGIVTASVTVSEPSPELRAELEAVQSAAAASAEDSGAWHDRSIAAARQAVRAVGWNVNRYPISSEAMLKRARKGGRVPSVNNVVDINNLLSIQSGWPIGSYNLANVEQPIEYRLGRAEEEYAAIKGSAFKLAALPLFADSQGPFGSLVRDSGRALIDGTAATILMAIFGFDRAAEMKELADRAAELLQRFAVASSVEVAVVDGRSQA
jgi:DNA/RNA-binding domain of Phe-tRNA-synthetase-like protein